MSRELFWFAIVGVTALLVHFLVVSLLVPLGLAPLFANVLAYLVAFQVSYWGHRLKTFEAGHLPHRQTLPRFFAVASFGFLLNETLYFILLCTTPLDYRVALLIVLLVVAGVTFVLSRLWAFYGAKA
ncbi:GtrA family protein [Pseudomonas cavernicola]|uniref:GtrA family protein n=1 Tax=Pseudomonas cavernicola TaxID=2320866 RepID=A0A418XLI6_9PSED|nr:GtrA family protein [Pseudomonas cavernicola]RJG13333.1 GtrA family protein [Pseudomonas cavernicola]